MYIYLKSVLLSLLFILNANAGEVLTEVKVCDKLLIKAYNLMVNHENLIDYYIEEHSKNEIVVRKASDTDEAQTLSIYMIDYVHVVKLKSTVCNGKNELVVLDLNN